MIWFETKSGKYRHLEAFAESKMYYTALCGIRRRDVLLAPTYKPLCPKCRKRGLHTVTRLQSYLL